MVKRKLTVRIESNHLQRLKNICRSRDITISSFIRKKILFEIKEGLNPDLKLKLKKIMKELSEPFAYIRTKQGIERAKKEKRIRTELIIKLKEAFNL